LNYLWEAAKIEREIEHTKQELVLMLDFNVIDAFRLFDRRECGYVGIIEFRDALYHMGVNVP